MPKRRAWTRRVWVLAGVAATIGCGRDLRPGRMAFDTLRLARATRLVQTDKEFVAKPFRMLIRADGSVLISDVGRVVVWWYRRDGTLRGSIGRRGEGPGEFLNPGAIVALDDSTIAVHDFHRGIFKVIQLPRGKELRTVATDAVVPLTGTDYRDTVWFGALAAHRGAAFGTIASLGSLVEWPASDSLTRTVWPMPGGIFRGMQPTPLTGLASQLITVDSTGFWVKYGVRNLLERRSRSGELITAWPIPIRHRHGIPAAQVAFGYDPANWNSPILADSFWLDRSFSDDRAFGQLANGDLVLATIDGFVEGKVLTQEIFVSILDPPRERACVDWVLPNPGIAEPLIAVVGDSVAILTQEPDATAPSQLNLMLRYYTLPLDQCDWQPMRPLDAKAMHEVK